MLEIKKYNRSSYYLQYAGVCGDLLKNELELKLKTGIFHDYELVPILFIFRHYLELQMKGLNYYVNELGYQTTIKPTSHDLLRPFRELLKPELQFLIRRPDSAVKTFVIDLGKIDSDGQGFRYPEREKSKSRKNIFQRMLSFILEPFLRHIVKQEKTKKESEWELNKKQNTFAVKGKYDSGKMLITMLQCIRYFENVEGDLDYR